MRRGAALGAMLVLAGCASSTVTLLPGEAGHPVGAVALLDADGGERGTLAAADRRARLGGRGAVHATTLSEAEVRRRYGTLIDDLPPAPRPFKLVYDTGRATLASDQEGTLQAILREAATRPGAEVQVIGHTDSLDTVAKNDLLSRRRAEQVRDYLIGRGLPAEQVRATWRGERDPAVPTADGVANADNRRVEVIIR